MRFLKNLIFFFTIILNTNLLTAQQKELVFVDSLIIEGNKVTKESIIRRELPFCLKDSLDYCTIHQVLERLRSNLLNTGLFNIVFVDYHFLDSVNIEVKIKLVEKWYIWPVPYFYVEDTNFNTWWKDKDWSRANYGFGLLVDNFRGRREQLLLGLQGGFNEKFIFQYTLPFINKQKTWGVGFYYGYHRSRQLVYNTYDNLRLFLKLYDAYAKKENVIKLWWQYRKGLYFTQQGQFYFYTIEVNDTVPKLNETYLTGIKQNFFLAKYFLKYDKRNFANYPTKGVYADFELGNYWFFGTKKNYPYVLGTIKKFYSPLKKIYFAHNFKSRYWLQYTHPYYITQTFGYGDNIRGYEYYVIDGQQWYMQKNQVKWAWFEWKTIRLPMIKNDRFGLVPLSIYSGLFFDQGMVRDLSGRYSLLANKYLYGYGFSLDFVSYYDIVLRFELSRNHKKETGFYIHFVAAI